MLGQIRGLLKIHGIKVSQSSSSVSFSLKVQEIINNLDEISKNSIELLVNSLEAIEESMRKLNKIILEQGKKDEDCVIRV